MRPSTRIPEWRAYFGADRGMLPLVPRISRRTSPHGARLAPTGGAAARRVVAGAGVIVAGSIRYDGHAFFGRRRDDGARRRPDPSASKRAGSARGFRPRRT